MTSFSRRAFLSTSSRALLGIHLERQGRLRLTPTSPAFFRSRAPIAHFMPDLVDPATLQRFAMIGVDAATRAGASYTDIRIADVRRLQMFQGQVTPYSWMEFEYAYGIRVCVDGTWGFTFGANPNPEGIARAARAAVATARSLSGLATPAQSLAPVPVIRGEWQTPIQVDPFSISPDEHAKMLLAYHDAAQRVADATVYWLRFLWTGETRVFASSEGTLLTQRLYQLIPFQAIQIRPPFQDDLYLPVPGIAPVSAGFESTTGPILQDRIKQVAEEGKRLARYPVGAAEIGRFEAVLDGTALGAICGATLGQALEMDRVLGFQADAAGTSHLAPVRDIIGHPLFSPLLNVKADRAPPHYGASKWDDEGVPTESFSVIERGHVVDYFATRTTIEALSQPYASIHRTPRLHGCATAWSSVMAPIGAATHLTVDSSDASVSWDALVSHVQNGVLVRGVADNGMNTDPQLSGGALVPAMLYEIKRGQITRRLTGGMLQFNTKKFWQGLSMIGGRDTMETAVQMEHRGQTPTTVILPVDAPSALLTSVDLINMGGAR